MAGFDYFAAVRNLATLQELAHDTLSQQDPALSTSAYRWLGLIKKYVAGRAELLSREGVLVRLARLLARREVVDHLDETEHQEYIAHLEWLCRMAIEEPHGLKCLATNQNGTSCGRDARKGALTCGALTHKVQFQRILRDEEGTSGHKDDGHKCYVCWQELADHEDHRFAGCSTCSRVSG